MHLFMTIQLVGGRAGMQTQQKALNHPVDVFKTLKSAAVCHHCEHTAWGQRVRYIMGLAIH